MIRARQLRRARAIAPRVAQIPLVLLVVSALVFVLVHVLPGDPARNALGPEATSEQVAAWSSTHGLDAGIFERYVSWFGGLLAGDAGTSIVYGVPVRELVLGRWGNSVVLGLLAFAILVPFAVGIGVFQASREGTPGDRVATVVLTSLAAVPEFVVGVLLLIVFAVIFPVFPVQSHAEAGSGPLPPWPALILPAVTLVIGALAVIARTARTGVIDVSRSAFYRTAVIKGVGPVGLLRDHVARNALIPTVSVLGVYIGALLAGSAVVETLFGYPGLGELLVTATQRKDAPVLAFGVMVTATASLFAVLAADVIFALMDPRVRFAGERR